MRITLLGTGTPTPLVERAGSSHMVETRKHVFLFDCGPCSHQKLLQAGTDLNRIDHLCITHWHYDHFADLPHLVLRRWDQGAGRVRDLDVYGPRPIRRIINLLFSENGVFGPDLKARTQNNLSVGIYRARGGTGPRRLPTPAVTEMKHNSIVKGKGWTLRTIEVPHAQPQLRSLAYRLDVSGEGCFVYTGDTGPTKHLVPFAEGADVLVHMCHYIAGTQLNEAMAETCSSHLLAATVAKRAGVRTLVLSHITEQIDTIGVRERVIHEISQIFDGRVIFGQDLKQLKVRTGRVSKPT